MLKRHTPVAALTVEWLLEGATASAQSAQQLVQAGNVAHLGTVRLPTTHGKGIQLSHPGASMAWGLS